MDNAVTATHPPGEAPIAVPVVSLQELWPWALLGVVLVVQIYFVGAVPDHTLHEFLHDSRHVLAFPCH
jgi:cobalt transporter subunit CbtB